MVRTGRTRGRSRGTTGRGRGVADRRQTRSSDVSNNGVASPSGSHVEESETTASERSNPGIPPCGLETPRLGRSKRSPEGQPRRRSSVSSTVSRKRRLQFEAEEQRVAIKRRAVNERAKLDLELVDKRLAFKLAEGSEYQGDTNKYVHQGRDDGSVRAWERASEHQNQLNAAGVHNHIERWGAGVDQSEIGEMSAQESRNPDSSSALMNRLTNQSLPNYYGDLMDWLRFKHAYNLSTRLGKFTEAENVDRLNKCLRGEAREAVRSLLPTTTDASLIMKTLEREFGNPTKITKKVIEDLKRLPRVGSGKMKLSTLTSAVSKAVAVMRSLDNVWYLHSPELCEEIMNKLPRTMSPLFNSLQRANPN